MFILKTTSFACVLWSVLLLSTGISRADSIMTEKQATQAAENFCRNIGQPAPGKSTASYFSISTPNAMKPMNSRLTSIRKSWQPLWHIEFTDKQHRVEIDIVDSDGVISSYFNHTVGVKSSLTTDDTSINTTITKEQAISNATAALQTAGAMKTGELRFKEAFFDKNSSTSNGIWFVSWEREFHGLPYREQDANVTIDAQSGDLKGFSVNFHTPPPTSASVLITQEQAQSIAAAELKRSGVAVGSPSQIKSEVVQPNVGDTDSPPYARVAWTCRFQMDRGYREVWVDAENGKIIGGELNGGPRGRVRVSDPQAKTPPKPLVPPAK